MRSIVRIIGTGITPFGELWEKGLTDLLHQAAWEAIESAKLDPDDIEAIYVSNMGAGILENQLHLGALISSFFLHFPPAMRIEGACASGGLALLTAEAALLSGQYKTVLVVGGEKMTDVSAAEATRMLAGASNVSMEPGATFPGLYALLAQAYQAQYGEIRETLSTIAVQNHRHSLDNPNAQFHKEFTIEQVSRSAPVADPLRLLDCSPLTDGAAAVILTTKRVGGAPRVAGTGHGMDALALSQRSSLTSLAATRRAARQAFHQAKLKPTDIPVAEVHDCFTIAQLLALEDIGFFKPGKALAATLNNQTTYDGQVIINPSGGLKASGHPVGATGIKQVAYLTRLLQQKAFPRALAHNVGGSGATAVVHILEGAR